MASVFFLKGWRELGIDCYIGKDNYATDVKNTKDIYVCQIFASTGIINSRHPFKKNTEATHYCVVNVSETQEEFIELVEIKTRLLRDYIKDEESLTKLYSLLQSFDQKHFKEKGLFSENSALHLEQGCIHLKNLIKPLLKPNVFIVYPTITEDIQEISFKITKSLDKPVVVKEVKAPIKEEVVLKPRPVQSPPASIIIIKV